MKFLLIASLLFISLTASAQSFYGTTDLAEFRKGRDAEFRDPRQSPLLGTDFEIFDGLKYFENDPGYRLNAIFSASSARSVFRMPTSAGTVRKYERAGVLRFALEGKEFSLSVFQMDEIARVKFPEYKDLLFVPFRDLTNGNETYGAGRYLSLRLRDDNTVILDFNLSYNPSCAFGSDRYSCPIPPKENFLQTRILAGEKKFNYSPKKSTDAKSRH